MAPRARLYPCTSSQPSLCPSNSGAVISPMIPSRLSSCAATAATARAAASLMGSFGSDRQSLTRASRAFSLAPGETLVPALEKTSAIAVRMLSLTWSLLAGFDAFTTRSPITGSTLLLISISCPRAFAPRSLTALASSERALTNEVCSCGTKGLSCLAPLSRRSLRVVRIAALTPEGNRSPTTRISGPVTLIRNGLRKAASVSSTISPMPDAATSRSRGDPFWSAC
mmetsp:Transcript_26382/g.36291  ORF Transcript_26382/g.36291 Transcript_26382/m.36291 type:complete len:226 (-) Transcript_26382:3664-4341(-)